MVKIVMEIQNKDKEKEASTAVAIAQASCKLLTDFGFVGCSISVKELPEMEEGKIDIPVFLSSSQRGRLEK